MKAVLVLFAAVCLVGAVTAYDAEDGDYAIKESLLDLDKANAARRASYQSNVGVVYTHLNEIIRKILVHKKAWAVKYQANLKRIAKELADKVAHERSKRKAKNDADAKLVVAKSVYKRKNDAWVKAHAALKQKTKDAAKERHDLGKLYKKGNGLKAGEIAMIVKIRCMLSGWNKDGKYSKAGKCVPWKGGDGEEIGGGDDDDVGEVAGGSSKKADGGKFGKAAKGDRICMLTNPKIVDMKPREEGPNTIDDIKKYVKNGAKRLYKFTDVVSTLKSGKCKGATLLLPEFQNRDINRAEAAEIRSFVRNGGSAILADDQLSRIMPLIRIVDPALKWRAGGTATAMKKTSSPRFAKCPARLPALNGGNSIILSSLGAGAQALYTAGSKVMVGQVKSGKGQIWFLGFDWYAKSRREGWAQVLAAVIG